MTTHIQILSSARSGSSYLFYALREYINPQQAATYVDLISYNEPFNPVLNQRAFPDQDVVTRKIQHLETTDSTHVIKNHHRHLKWLQEHDHVLYDRYRNLDFLTIVLLRKNLFESTLSWCIANETGEFIHYKNTQELTIDPEFFEKKLKRDARFLNAIAQNYHGFRYDKIMYYEDLKFDPRADFLNTSFCLVHPDILPSVTVERYVEKSPEKAQRVTNYESLYSLACQTLDEYNKEPETANIKIQDAKIVDFQFRF